MFIFEILIYIFFTWIMFSLARNSELRYGGEDRIDKYLWWYILFFTFIAAIRWRTGEDSVSYILTLRNGLIIKGSQEHLWNWFVCFIHNYNIHFSIGMGVTAFFQIFFLTKAFEKYKPLLVWLPVVLFGGRYFLDMMNAVRQMIVACGFLFLSNYIVQKKAVPYIAGILLLSQIHHSALIILFFYGLAYVPFEKIRFPQRRTLCMAILAACLIFGQIGSFLGMTGYIEPLTSLIGYENYSDRAVSILGGASTEQLAFGPMMLSYLMISILVIWYAPRLHEEYGDIIPEFNLWYFLSFIFSCFFFLVCNLSHLAIRFAQYFEFFQVAMLALLLHYLYCNRTKMQQMLIIVILSIWLSTSVDIFKNRGVPYEASTYKTIFSSDAHL